MSLSRKDDRKLSSLYTGLYNEDMATGDVYGGGEGHGGDVGNTDWYAPGDSRVPTYLGSRTRWQVYDPEKQQKEEKRKRRAKKKTPKSKKSKN